MNKEKNTLIAKRYAESLLQFGKEDKISYETISKDLNNVKAILTSSKELFNTLTNPLISNTDKGYIVEKVFSQDVNVLTKNFLKLLVEKDRFDLIDDVIKIYGLLLDEINGIARIEVISAIELNDMEQGDIQAKLASKLKKQIVIKYNIDESIIAGLVVKMGDDIIDMSVARKLEEYKMALTK